MKIVNNKNEESVIKRTKELCDKYGFDESKIEIVYYNQAYFHVYYTIDDKRKFQFQGNYDEDTPLYGLALIHSNIESADLYVDNSVPQTKENIDILLDKEMFDMCMQISQYRINLKNVLSEKEQLREIEKKLKEIYKIIDDADLNKKN